MSRLVKILLAILAVLLIAAGGFWSGTRFAYQQVASDPTRQAAVTAAAAPSQGLASPQDNNTPQADNSQQNNNGPRSNDNRDDSRQSNQNNRFGFGMMGPNNNRQWGNYNQNRPSAGNSGRMMPGFNNGNEPGSMTGVRQHNGGFGMFAGGGFMSGVFMFFGLLFPLGFGILMVLGIIILFRIVRHTPPAPAAATTPCTKCGTSLQAGWSYCPHCGEPIQK